MVKEVKIKELVYGKLADMLKNHLSSSGFKYLKSKQAFIKQQGDIHQILYLSYPYAPLTYDEHTDKLFLSFTITPGVEVPKFDKWYSEKTRDNIRFSCRKPPLNSEIEIPFEEFAEEDFYTPTASAEFKRNITLSFMNKGEQKENFIPFDNLIHHGLQDLASAISGLSDIEKIIDSCGHTLSTQHLSLLYFGGYTEKANDLFDQAYHSYLEEIEEKQKTEEAEAKRQIDYLDIFIASAKKVAQRSYTNPFKRSIKVLDGQDEKFDLSSNTKFKECLRLDVSPYEIKSFHINSIGEILLFANNSEIFKFSPGGELLFQQEIAAPDGFDKFWTVKSGLIKETDEFFINNYIISKSNTFIALPLPAEKKKGKKLQNPHIIDLAYSRKNDQYLVLYQNSFITYNRMGEAEKSIPVEQGYYNRIIPEKGWIVSQKKDTANLLLDFDGQTLGTYEFAQGNHFYEFSNSLEMLVCFFYAAKSQLYDLVKGKKETLWAHPTYIKGYKETLYNDINHNFGLTIARFSPDDQYIVGGAEHGKYVAWTLPKMERVELIPKPEVINLLEPLVATYYSEGKRIDIVTKAEVVILENQLFLKNRKSGISNIIFFENGNLFLTELGASNLTLLWDRNFNNLAYYRTKGKIELHSQKYLTQTTGKEIIVYEME